MNPTPVDQDRLRAAELLFRLAATIGARRDAAPDESYVAGLFAAGNAAIARKVGEEAVETVLAAAAEDREAVVRESADLVFHLMVLWERCGIGWTDIADELARREGLSGLEEKRRRTRGARSSEG